MSGWRECPNRQECMEGNRYGKGCVEDHVQSAMGGRPWHECHCGVDNDGNPPNRRQADEITRLRAEVQTARALALEEAARCAEATTAYDDNVQKSAGCATTGQRIAAAIRALAKNGEKND